MADTKFLALFIFISAVLVVAAYVIPPLVLGCFPQTIGDLNNFICGLING